MTEKIDYTKFWVAPKSFRNMTDREKLEEIEQAYYSDTEDKLEMKFNIFRDMLEAGIAIDDYIWDQLMTYDALLDRYNLEVIL